MDEGGSSRYLSRGPTGEELYLGFHKRDGVSQDPNREAGVHLRGREKKTAGVIVYVWRLLKLFTSMDVTGEKIGLKGSFVLLHKLHLQVQAGIFWGTREE